MVPMNAAAPAPTRSFRPTPIQQTFTSSGLCLSDVCFDKHQESRPCAHHTQAGCRHRLEAGDEKQMDDTRDVEQAIELLLDSPSGQLMTRFGTHIRRRWLWLLSATLIGFATGFSSSTRLILWLTETSGLVPPSVDIVVLSPLEVILIRLRIATLLGLFSCGLLLLVDLSMYARNDSQIRDLISQADLQIRAPPLKIILTIIN